MITIRADHENKKVLISVDATLRIRKGLRIGLTQIGKENSRHTRKLIKDPPKTGRFYPFRGGLHQASAPGEAPANKTGDLMKSVHSRVYGWEKMEFGDGQFYGVYLENGTRNRRIAARPHLKTTVNAKSRDNYLTLEQEVLNRINRI